VVPRTKCTEGGVVIGRALSLSPISSLPSTSVCSSEARKHGSFARGLAASLDGRLLIVHRRQGDFIRVAQSSRSRCSGRGLECAFRPAAARRVSVRARGARAAGSAGRCATFPSAARVIPGSAPTACRRRTHKSPRRSRRRRDPDSTNPTAVKGNEAASSVKPNGRSLHRRVPAGCGPGAGCDGKRRRGRRGDAR